MWIATGVFILLIVIFGAGFYIYSPRASPSLELKECKTLNYNGEGATNIVFFSSKENAEKYIKGLLEFEPFSANKDFFNFYYIDNYEPECEMYKGVALLCYSGDLLKSAGSCPNDVIVVVKEMDSSIRSSAYMNVISLNSELPISVFAHELGHVFANLADEYVPAKLSRGVKNCVEECDKFGDKSEGCFEGCSESDYFRSIDTGVMRSLESSRFGAFNELILEDKISTKKKGVTGMAVGDDRDCVQEQYYLIEGVYQNDKMQVLGQEIAVGCVGNNGEGEFDYQVLDEKDEMLSKDNFNPEFIFTDINKSDGVLSGGSAESDRAFILKVPVIDKAKKLDIRREGESISSIELDRDKLEAKPCRIL